MPGGDVTSVARVWQHCFAFVGSKRLHDDLCLIPSISTAARSQREKHRPTPIDNLRTVCRPFIRLYGYQRFRHTAVSSDSHDPLTEFCKYDLLSIPADAERRARFADRYGSSATDCDFF